MSDQDQLRQTIAALEAQRALLGDAVVDTALAPLREKLAQLEAQRSEEQRKLVTVLFADLVNFTALSEKLDPEEVRDITNAYFARWTGVIEKHGGVVEKFIGDAVMAVFGMAAAHENDPENAIFAALEMKASLAELNRELAANDSPAEGASIQLRVRTGIHTGLAVIGRFDERGNRDFVVVGDTVNLASRLQTHAPADGILISRDTYRHVRGVFDVEAVEPLQLKGKSEPVGAYRVLQAKPRAFRVSLAAAEGSPAALVGRESELRTLKEAYRHVKEKRSRRVVTVVGEAGMGKSRLIFELDDWIETQPGDYYYFLGRANQSMQTVSYSLLRDVIAFRFQIQESDHPRQVLEKLEQGVKEAFGEDESAPLKAYFIGRLLGFELGSRAGAGEVDARQILERGLVYMEEYFGAMTAKGTVVALLEDIHWADDNTLALLERLDQALSDRPVLMVCTARPSLYQRQPHWEEGPAHHIRIDLHPLSREESSRLVGEILHNVTDLPAELSEAVVGSAEGNPFYIEEIIKMLVEEGVIESVGEAWRVNPGRLALAQIPSTLTEVLQSRFDVLSREEKTTLQKAAVIGRTFWDAAVDSLGQPEPGSGQPCQAALAGLVRREMIFQQEASAFEGTREYQFRHALFRDVTYESLLKRYRKVYHAAAARWLQEVTTRSGRADEFARLIASHLDQAGEAAAADWYARAAAYAAARYANAEALKHFSRALELFPPGASEQRFAALLGRVRVYHLLGERQEQLGDLQALEQAAESLDLQDGAAERRALAAVEWALYSDQTGDYPAAIGHAQRVVEQAALAGNRALEARGHHLWGSASWHFADYPAARREGLVALELAQKAGLASQQAQSLHLLGIVADAQGEYQDALSFCEQALANFRKTGDQVGESRVLNSLGVVTFNMNDLTTTHVLYLQSLQLKRQIGDRYGEGVTLNNLGIVARRQSQLTAALEYYRQCLEVCREIADQEGESASLNGLGSICMALGDFARAEGYFLQSLEITRKIGDQEGDISNLSSLGELAFQRGNLQAALEYYAQGLEVAGQLGARNYEGYMQLGIGDVWLKLGDLEKAGQAFRRSVEVRRELGQAGLLVASRAGLARLALREGQVDEACALAREVLGALGGSTEVAKDELILVYLTCYRCLAACHDPASHAALQAGLAVLEETAANIHEDALRESFLQAVPYNRELLALRGEAALGGAHG